MMISEHQLLIALDSMRGSLAIADGGTIFGYDRATRTKIYNEIINQSSQKLVEIGDLKASSSDEQRAQEGS